MDILEKRILTDLKYGSKKAFEYVFKTYYDPLMKYAEEILKNRDQAEDVIENLFVIIWEDRKLLDIHTSFRSYLYRSTYNACMNVIRKRKSESKYRDFFTHHTNFLKTHDYGSLSYPLTGLIEKEINSEISNIIDKLPPQCKKIFLMSRSDNLTHQEIAEELGISVNTVKCHIMNALKVLQVALKDLMIVLILLLPV
jgi:RNA polymerase sigma-70 factor, ECF subfamily